MTNAQLPLSFEPGRPRYARADFIVGDANKNALAMADAWAKSEETRLVICGPKSAGKTHLASIVATAMETQPNGRRGETVWISGGALSSQDIDGRMASVVIDNADRADDPKRLLAVIERILIDGGRVVLTGRGAPSDWAQGLRDLETRLSAMSRIDLAEPDEELLRAVMQKLFIDRQLRVDPAVSAYAAPRLERTFSATEAFVAAIDAASAERRAPISRVLAGQVIAELSVNLVND